MSSALAVGWTGEVVVILCFGVFGVFHKLRPMGSLLFVYWTTFGAALTSLVVFAVCGKGGVTGVCSEVGWTWYGLLSGALICGGFVGTPFAIDLLGMGAAQATWGAVMIIASFLWGTFAWNEAASSVPLAVVGVTCLIIGILLVALAESIVTRLCPGPTELHEQNLAQERAKATSLQQPQDGWGGEPLLQSPSSTPFSTPSSPLPSPLLPSGLSLQVVGEGKEEGVGGEGGVGGVVGGVGGGEGGVGGVVGGVDGVEYVMDGVEYGMDGVEDDGMDGMVGGVVVGKGNGSYSKRRKWGDTVAGVGVCVVLGIVGGFTLVPAHYAPPALQGLAYLPSFAIGAHMVGTFLFLLRFLVRHWLGGAVVDAHAISSASPPWARALAGQAPRGTAPTCGPSISPLHDAASGIACGALWCVGNAGVILGIQAIGYAVAFPLSQAGILVGGVVGILAFGEVHGTRARIVFAAGILVSLAGATLLGTFGPKQ